MKAADLNRSVEWSVMSHTGQIHIEADRNLAEISVNEFRIHGQPAYLVCCVDGHWVAPNDEATP